MIGFQDFAPVKKSKGGFLKLPELEQLQSCTKRANEWINEHDVDVLNIETVVLPNIHSPRETGSTDPQLETSGKMRSSWYQIVRVWYRY